MAAREKRETTCKLACLAPRPIAAHHISHWPSPVGPVSRPDELLSSQSSAFVHFSSRLLLDWTSHWRRRKKAARKSCNLMIQPPLTCSFSCRRPLSISLRGGALVGEGKRGANRRLLGARDIGCLLAAGGQSLAKCGQSPTGEA